MAGSDYFLRPSSAGRWVHCTGSAAMCAAFPTGDTEATIEGTVAHAVAAEWLAGRETAEGTVIDGVEVTDEMIDGAALFASIVLLSIDPVHLHVERSVPIPDIHAQNGGTPDAWGLSFDRQTLHVVDYKFGHGFVEVFENWQLIDYVSGAVRLLSDRGDVPPNFEDYAMVEMTIVQPRNYHRDGPVRTWRVQLKHLRAQFNVLRGAAEIAVGPNPPLRTGPWCDNCEARHACVALRSSAAYLADRAGDAPPHNLTPEQVGSELRQVHHSLALLNAYATGLEAEAEALLRKGKAVPHYALQPGDTREVWRDGMEAGAIALGDLLGVQLRKPESAVTPAQARKKGIDGDVISAYAHRPPGAMKLVPVDTLKTRKIFGA